MFFMGALYLQRVLGYDALEIGLAFLPVDARHGHAVAALLRAADHALRRPRARCCPGLVLIVAGLLLFTRRRSTATTSSHVLPVMVLLGAGAGVCVPGADDAGDVGRHAERRRASPPASSTRRCRSAARSASPCWPRSSTTRDRATCARAGDSAAGRAQRRLPPRLPDRRRARPRRDRGRGARAAAGAQGGRRRPRRRRSPPRAAAPSRPTRFPRSLSENSRRDGTGRDRAGRRTNPKGIRDSEGRWRPGVPRPPPGVPTSSTGSPPPDAVPPGGSLAAPCFGPEPSSPQFSSSPSGMRRRGPDGAEAQAAGASCRSRARPTPRSSSAAPCRSAAASARAPRRCRSRGSARRSAAAASARGPLEPGPNVIDVAATARNRSAALTAFRVTREQRVAVPDLVGAGVDDAERATERRGLTPRAQARRRLPRLARARRASPSASRSRRRAARSGAAAPSASSSPAPAEVSPSA